MGTFFRLLLAAAIVFQLFSGTAVAYEEGGLDTNKVEVEEYILQLKKGENPDKITRPVLKKARTREAKQVRRKLINAMDQAEELARQGKSNLIEDPVWIFETSPEKKPEKKPSKY